MPPKADKKPPKEKPVKGAEAEQMVLAYMKSTNRPYSSNDVSVNLKDRVAKAEAARALTSLAEKGQVTSKAYGKQTIFVYNQSLLDVLSAEEMAQLDGQAKEAKEELEARKKDFRSIQNELNAILSTPKTPDLAKAIQEIKASNDKLVKALAAYRGESAAPPMTADDMNKIDKDWAVWRKAWVERKKTYKEAVGILQEGNMIGSKLAEWEEEQGIEAEDEEAVAVENGEFVKIPPKPVPNKSKPTATTLGKRPRAATASAGSSKRSTSAMSSL